MTNSFFTRLSLLTLLLWQSPLLAATDVKLSLKLDHEFQFAGYYAAELKGYYAAAELNVDIQSGYRANGSHVSTIAEVLAGQAEFGIAGMDILFEPDASDKLRILAPIFQQSSATLFSLDSQKLNRLQDLKASRIAVNKNDALKFELISLLQQLGITKDNIEFIDEEPSLETLRSNKADAILSYSQHITFEANKSKLIINELPLRNYHRRFYGDILFTSRTFAANNPSITQKFLEASLKGWKYALEHPREIIDYMAEAYPPVIHQQYNTEAYNLFFANTVSNYIQYPAVPLGYSDQGRWKHIVDSMLITNAIDHKIDLEKLILSAQSEGGFPLELLLLIGLGCVCLIMIFYAIAKNHHKLLFILMTAGVFSSALLTEQWLLEQINDQERLNQQETNVQLRTQLEAALNNSLTSIYGLATHISANPNITTAQFDLFSSAVMRRDPVIRNLAAAPNLIVTLVYPLAGNEAALGLNYNNKPEQREVALRVRDRGEMALAGPVELVQGGLAFISRAPVFFATEERRGEFWGIVAGPIDAEKLMMRAGFDPDLLITDSNPHPQANMSIRGKDGKGATGDVFYGDGSVFTNPLALTTPISIGGDSWMLATLPNYSTSLSTRTLLITRATALLIFIIFSALIIVLRKQDEKRKSYEYNIFQNQALLTEIGDIAEIAGLRVNSQQVITEINVQVFKILRIEAIEPPFTAQKLSAQLTRVAALKLLFVMKKCLSTHTRQQTEIFIEHEGGVEQWIKVIFSPQQDGELIGALQDITRNKTNEKTIREQATIDRVTRLPNRWFFTEQIGLALTKVKRSGNKAALLFIDVDNFKSINDSLGHSIGDDFLRAIAGRLKECIRESDIIARLGGDEFTILLNDIDDYKIAFKISENIIHQVSQAFMLAGHQIFSSVSIGISIFPDDATDVDTLLSHADQAMYASKQQGKNSSSFFTLAMQQQSERQHWIYNELVRAIESEDIVAVYQPIYCLASHTVVDCEALARWPRTDGNNISPVEFIPVAESSGLISRLDLLMLKQALALLDKTETLGISINISPRLFHEVEKGFAHWRTQVLSSPRKEAITVEITERLLVDEQVDAESLLAELQQEGLAISLDDFGTGYSSLSYLSRFNVNKLKIDRSFIMAIGENPTQEALIETILSMGEKLGIDVVAEGIETQQQLEFLRSRGCRYGQGFFLARPMNEQQLLELLAVDGAVECEETSE